MGRMIFGDDKYTKIIDFICKYKEVSEIEMFKLIKYKESKYLLLLLLQNYRCIDYRRIISDFNVRNDRIIKNNLRKAEEKLYVSREFRDLYFEFEEMIKKII